MTPAPINLGELERLCEALRKVESGVQCGPGSPGFGGTTDRLRNPDGPEAADAIEALTARLRAAEGALRPFAKAAETIVRDCRSGQSVVITPADTDPFPAGQITWGDLRAAAKAVPPPPDTTTSSGEG